MVMYSNEKTKGRIVFKAENIDESIDNITIKI